MKNNVSFVLDYEINLYEHNWMNDLTRATSDSTYLDALFDEYDKTYKWRFQFSLWVDTTNIKLEISKDMAKEIVNKSNGEYLLMKI